MRKVAGGFLVVSVVAALGSACSSSTPSAAAGPV
ncbi:MAG: hypothetical protein JWM74_231, partial [Myxococcaceae bacterium]|nr:hypothetical protein [Myxococcaceae bacterium]